MRIPALLVYLISIGVGVLSTVLLLRAYRRSPSRLVLAMAICFAGFVLNDLALVVDLFALPDMNLMAVRSLPALAGLAVLVRALAAEGR